MNTSTPSSVLLILMKNKRNEKENPTRSVSLIWTHSRPCKCNTFFIFSEKAMALGLWCWGHFLTCFCSSVLRSEDKSSFGPWDNCHLRDLRAVLLHSWLARGRDLWRGLLFSEYFFTLENLPALILACKLVLFHPNSLFWCISLLI